MLAGLAFLACLAGGLAVNSLRSDPLPLAYKPRSQRVPAGPVIPTVSLAEITADERKSPSTFLDAREEDFFEEGHLPGAINLPASRIAAGDFHGLPGDPSTPLIVYCSGGDCPDSHVVAAALVARGFRNVSIFAGGWDEWSAAGSRP